MDDFDFVAVPHDRLRPACAANDFTVEFDGEAFGRKCELADERVEREFVRQFANFPIDMNAQNFSLSGLVNDAAQFGCEAVEGGAHEHRRAPFRKARQPRMNGRHAVGVRARI